MSKRKSERFHSAWWEIREDDGEDPPVPYWYGYCEGDMDGDRLDSNEPLMMFPDCWPIGTRIDVEEPEDSAFYDRFLADRGTPEAVARHYREKASADLLAACEAAIPVVVDAIMHGMPITPAVTDARNKLVAAIAKAKGRPAAGAEGGS